MKSKSKNTNNAFASLMLFEKQKHQYLARRHSLKITIKDFKKAKA